MPARALAFSFPDQVNEHAARLVATAVSATLVVGIFTGTWWLVPVLASGFLLRVAWGPRFSVLARIAMAIARRLWVAKPVTGAPKRFAQAIGATCTGAATVLFLAGLPAAGWGLAGVVAFFAFLEAAFAFCMGCWIFRHLQRLGIFSSDACTNCGPGQHGDGI